MTALLALEPGFFSTVGRGIGAILLYALIGLLLMLPRFSAASGEWLLWGTYVELPGNEVYDQHIEEAFESQRACQDAIPVTLQARQRFWSVSYTRVIILLSTVTADRPRGGGETKSWPTTLAGPKA